MSSSRGGRGLELTAAPSPDDIAFIERNLVEYNVARAVPYDRVPLCVFAKDPDGRVVGGATGHTNWGWLYLDCFWLPESARKSGLGAEILAMAEREAGRRGCTRSCLYTYSFQAQGFYEKHGYTVFGVQEDYPPGHRKIWMRKELPVADDLSPGPPTPSGSTRP